MLESGESTPDNRMTSSISDFRLINPLSAGRSFTIVIASCMALLAAGTVHAAPKFAPPSTITALDLDGKPTTLATLLKGPTVLNIWATWCPPCRTEMPSLEAMQAVLAPEGIQVLALSVDTDHNLVREFVLKYRLTLPIGIATEPDQAVKAMDIVGLPSTIYLDAAGREVARHVGQRDWASPEAIAEARRHLRARSAPAAR